MLQCPDVDLCSRPIVVFSSFLSVECDQRLTLGTIVLLIMKAFISIAFSVFRIYSDVVFSLSLLLPIIILRSMFNASLLCEAEIFLIKKKGIHNAGKKTQFINVA